MRVSVRKQPSWLQVLLILPGVAALVVTFVFPLLWLARTSLQPTTGHILSLHAYVRLFEDSFYWWVIGRTIFIGLLCVVITVPMAFPVALFLARSQSRWRGTLTALAIAPLLTSTVIRTYGWMVILGRHGLINTTLVWAGILAQPTR
ncbi:MAG: ABC transporter permease, partial [Gluconobacter sp.]